MKKIITLRILLLAIVLIACLTAGIDYPINSEILKFYFSGVRLNGYIMAACMAAILGVLPKFIGNFYSNDRKLYGHLTISLAGGLFSLILFAQLEAGYGLFSLILVVIFFALNTILCLFYHDLKIKYGPAIKEFTLKKLLRKHQNKFFLVTKELENAKGLADKEARTTVAKLLKDTKSSATAKKARRDALKRAHEQRIKQLKALMKSIDDDIDNAYQTFAG